MTRASHCLMCNARLDQDDRNFCSVKCADAFYREEQDRAHWEAAIRGWVNEDAAWEDPEIRAEEA